MAYIKAGEEFWNDDHTEGYRVIKDIERFTPVMADQFEALGAAPKPVPEQRMRKWAEDIFAKPGGVEAYHAGRRMR